MHSPENPYQATGGTSPPPYRGGGLEYGRMVSFVFENPRWFVNLLLMGVCQLIPIIGPMVVLGYQFDTVEALHRDPRRRYPDFDFGRFVDYLVRGLWPFLVVLIASVILVPLMMGCSAAVIIGIGLAVAGANTQSIGPMMLTLLPLIILTAIVVGIGIQLLLLPLQLRAGLAQDFAAAFDFSFFKSFLATMWKEALVGMLFLAVVGVAAAIVGFAMCFIGIYLTMGVVMLAQANYYFQLYELYLERGGQPIPLKPHVPAPLPRPQV